MKFNQIVVENVNVSYSREEFLNQLALESSFKDNVASLFQKGIPSLVEKFKAYINEGNKPDEDPSITALDANLSATQRHRLEEHYLTYRDVLVQVPEGFKGEFLEYALELNSIGSSLFEQTHKLLTEYRFALSSILTNAEQRTSLKDLSANYERTAAARADLGKRLSAFFQDNTVSRARLVDVLPQYKSAKDLVRQIKELHRVSGNKQLEEIQTSVKTVVEYLSLVETRLADESISDVSPTVVKNIANGAHELALYVDAVVAYHYAAVSLITCVDLMLKKMSDLA